MRDLLQLQTPQAQKLFGFVTHYQSRGSLEDIMQQLGSVESVLQFQDHLHLFQEGEVNQGIWDTLGGLNGQHHCSHQAIGTPTMKLSTKGVYSLQPWLFPFKSRYFDDRHRLERMRIAIESHESRWMKLCSSTKYLSSSAWSSLQESFIRQRRMLLKSRSQCWTPLCLNLRVTYCW